MENGRDEDDDDDDDEEEVARGTYVAFNEDARMNENTRRPLPFVDSTPRARRVFDARCSVTRARSDEIIWYKRCDGSRSVSR